ncbi:hypothetical protein QQF64_023576 [Cirrhinus molitorella]|uniref:DDE Tnp4 domain-containing protein n=1 Tax=Cirrhinus molitorella TaxID=172907 RepID=A0ABR3NIT4_9TELE
MTLTNTVACWPGSAHDFFILTHRVGNRLQARAGLDGWLLGDTGYPLRRWLLTPFLNPQSAQQMRYNEVHARARTVVERAIGLLKCRWRALDASGGKLLYHQAKVCKIIRVCGVLHNVALRAGIPLPPDLAPPQHYDPEPHPPARHEGYEQGARIRENVMRRLTASVSTRPLLDVLCPQAAPLLRAGCAAAAEDPSPLLASPGNSCSPTASDSGRTGGQTICNI